MAVVMGSLSWVMNEDLPIKDSSHVAQSVDGYVNRVVRRESHEPLSPEIASL